MTFEGFELVIFNCFPHLQASSKYTVCISHLYATAPPSSSHHPPQQHPGLRFKKKKKTGPFVETTAEESYMYNPISHVSVIIMW